MTPTPNPEDGSAFGEIDLTRYWHLLIHQSWVIALLIVVGLAGASTYLARTPKVYTSTATIEVEAESRKMTTFQQVMASEFKTSEGLKTVEQSLLTASLMLRVIHVNNLTEDPTFVKPRPDKTPYPDSYLVERFEKKISVTLRRGTRLIDITLIDESPEKARVLAQSVVDQFLLENSEQKLRVSRMASSALQREADELKMKVERSERNLQEYREKHHAVSLEDKQNIIVDKLKALNEKTTQAKQDRLKLESDMAVINATGTGNPEHLLLLSAVSTQPEVENLRKQIQEKEAEFFVLKERYLEKHPRYIQAETQIKDLKAALRTAATRAGEKVAQSYQAAKTMEAKLVEALAEQEKLSLELHSISIPYNVLVREVESDRALYSSVLNGLKETNATKSLESTNIRLLDAPIVSSSPFKPNPLKIILMAIVGGFAIGTGLIICYDILNGAIRSVEDVESGLSLPVLAAVPAGKFPPGTPENIVHSLPQSSSSEAFRLLRTSIALLGKQAEHRVVLFTSAVPGEGKTFCSINYAASLAQQGLRTLLVDADLRNPRLSRIMLEDDPDSSGSSTNMDGLSGCLSGAVSLPSACKNTKFPWLSILPAGRKAPNPSELLGSRAVQELIDEASQNFDRVVIDTPPVNAVSDALMLMSYAQSVCMVIRTNSTSRRAVFRGLRLITRAGRKPDGVVLNRTIVRKKATQDYIHYTPTPHDVNQDETP
ncbi:MAG: polysaccharide biosynthesis tyrosine autokinase [Verrucomicrobiota bacterium]